jgi:predicted GIY-YIG superfamily endonuclease
MNHSWYCYCLESSTGSTYIGSTIDPDRRLRQHNRELSGGAKATGRGTGWKRICCITGFPDESSALQFEWKWKFVSKQFKGKPLEKRFRALETIINSEQSTSKAKPFSTYDGPLCLFLEDESCNYLKTIPLKYAIVSD